MILHGLFAALALLSLGLTLWQWLAGRRFPLHARFDWSAGLRPGAKDNENPPDPSNRRLALPPITLLKPLKGGDEHTERCLRSWFAQNYAGDTQLLFAVGDASDPVCVIVNRLLHEFPRRDAQLVLCPERRGANAKVSKLAQLQPLAKHDMLVVSDADVFAPPDLLANLVVPLAPTLFPPDGETVADRPGEGTVGLVNCFYRLANPATLAMRCEAVAVNADFWSQVLQSCDLKPPDFALGAVMAVRREALELIGGFAVFADHLADDYQLGHRIARAGWRVAFCPAVVECWAPPRSWTQVWAHQLRWARTIRVCQPRPYFFSILSNATLWPLLWLAVAHPTTVITTHTVGQSETTNLSVNVPLAVFAVLACVLLRIATALDSQRRLTQSRSHFKDWWLVPVKDLMQAAVWLLAFLGNRITWRGERYRLQRDGRLVKT